MSMKDKKDTVEINDVKDEMIKEAETGNVEAGEALAEKMESLDDGAGAAETTAEEIKVEPAYYKPTESKIKMTGSWGNKAVTRKFLIASLVLTLLLNAALTAGMSALFGRHGLKNRSGFSDNNQNSRPNFEQFDDGWGNGGGRGYNGGGRMMPPGSPYDNNWNGNQNNNQNNSQNNNQNAAPDNNQNAAPNTNQDNTRNNTQNNTQNDTQTQGTSFEI